MTDYINELFLKLACNTPLPTGTSASTNIPPFTHPQTTATKHVNTPLKSFPQPAATSAPQQKKRSRKPEFTIFIDADAANVAPLPSSKKTKLTPRTPLTVKNDIGNDSPIPSPRAPDVPWTFSSTDPLWDNMENYFPYRTPPPTPHRPSPMQSFYSQPYSRPSSRSSSRPTRTRPTTFSTARVPKNMMLYNLLELEDWKAGSEEIKLSYKKAAMRFHPDKVVAERREEATMLMQRLNAAKEVLLDTKRRRAYNRSGNLPWDT